MHHQSSAPELSSLIIYISLLVAALPAEATNPRRLADVRTELVQSSFLAEPKMVKVNSSTDSWLFVANDPQHGRELWATDLLPTGTELLVDLNPGPTSSFPRNLVQFDEMVYFIADTLEHGQELWRSDGTAPGTERVTDLSPGGSDGVYQAVVSGANLFLGCETPNQGVELCVFDGTTMIVHDLLFGPESSFPSSLAAMPNDSICFAATLPTTGREPWCSDGTIAGTTLIGDIVPGEEGSSPFFISQVDATRIIFQGNLGQGFEPIVVDRGTGSVTALDVNPGNGSSLPSFFTTTPDGVFYIANSDLNGRELYFFNANTGVNSLFEIAPGAADGLAFNTLLAVNSSVVFTANDGVIGEEVWFSDGTIASNFPEIRTGPEGSAPRNLFFSENQLLVQADDGVHDSEIWRFNNGLFSWERVTDLQQGSDDPDLAPLAVAGSHLVFRGTPLLDQEDSVYTVPVGGGSATKISPDTRGTSSSPNTFADSHHGIVFRADSGDGLEPHVFDGVTASQIADLVPGDEGSDPDAFVSLNEFVLFTTRFGSAADDEPYLWDGANVQKININPVEGSNPSTPQIVNDRALLFADDGQAPGLYSLDPAGPVLETFPFSSLFSFDTAGDVALLSVRNGAASDLYVSDGTPAGTELVTSLPAPSGVLGALRESSPGVDPLVALFVSPGQTWVSDGTVAGTTLINPDILESSTRGAFVNADERLLGIVRRGEDLCEDEYYLIDGTVAGTGIVTDRLNDPLRPSFLFCTSILGTVPGGWIIRDVRTDVGVEPWFMDGVNPPVPLDIWPGPDSSNPSFQAARIGEHLYFWASTPERGNELWRTDGTLEGTVPMPELHPGPAGESITSVVAIDHHLVFSAIGPAGDGNEPWVLDPPLFFDTFETGDTSRWSSAVP